MTSSKLAVHGETDPAAPAPKSLSKLSLGQGNWAVQAGLKRLGMCEKTLLKILVQFVPFKTFEDYGPSWISFQNTMKKTLQRHKPRCANRTHKGIQGNKRVLMNLGNS